MGGIFTYLYTFFSKKKLLFYILLLILILFIGFFSSRLSIKEDISKMMPNDEETKMVQLIADQLKFTDKLIFNVHFSDSLKESNPDSLILFTDSLINNFNKSAPFPLFDDISYYFDDALFDSAYNAVYNNLPIFLTENDYNSIDSLITEESIKESIEGSFKSLNSPISGMMKKFIIKDPLGFTFIALKKLRNLNIDEELTTYNGYIFSENKNNLIFFTTIASNTGKTDQNELLLEEINKAIDTTSGKFNNSIQADYFGSPAIAVANAKRIKDDIMLTITIAIIVIFIFISIYFRKISAFIIIFIPVVIGAGLAIAFLYIIKKEVSTISLGLGSVLLGITIDYSLHLFTHYKKTGSVKKMLKDVSVPVLMSATTTVTACLCLFVVDSEIIHELGLFVSLSIIGAALSSLIIYPHFLKYKKQKLEKMASSQAQNKGIVNKIANYAYEKNRYLILLILVLSTLFFFTKKYAGFEEDISQMNYMSPELTRIEKELDQINNYKLKSVYLASTGKNFDTALKNNEKIISKLDSLKSSGIIQKYSGVSSALISENLQKERIDRWNSYWTTEKKQSLSELIKTYGQKKGFKETAFNSFYDQLNTDFKTVNTIDLMSFSEDLIKSFTFQKEDLASVITMVKLEETDKPKLYEKVHNEEGLTIIDFKGLTTKFVDIIKVDFDILVLLSMSLVFLILIMVYGRIEIAIVTFIPITISWIWTLGIMGLSGMTFNIFNIIISTFIFGLGIDYSIFITNGLMQEYKTGVKNFQSFKSSILLSVVTSVTGLGVLIFAQHPAVKSIALLSITGILSVVIIAFTIQPVLFNFLTKSNGLKRTGPVTLVDFIFSILALLTLIVGSIVLTLLVLIPLSGKKGKRIYHAMICAFNRFIVYIQINIKKTILGKEYKDFSTPKIIIANHQAHIDISLMLMLNPKIIILTNDWVQKNPFYGFIVRLAEYYPVSKGYEPGLDFLSQKVKDGYSIMIFPEGTRSKTQKIGRFHKGAFYLAEKLNIDIQPVLLHGTGDCIPKGEPFLKSGAVTIKFLPPISIKDQEYGITYQDRSKNICKHMRTEYEDLITEYVPTKYYNRKVINNFLYKGPILEWYVRIKLMLENHYATFNKYIPKDATITDIGCGYGYVSMMLYLVSKNRKLIGIDYDEDKIAVANSSALINKNLSFSAGDVTKTEFENSDVFLLGDVLHYMNEKDQESLLDRCIGKLNKNGIIIIRDGNDELDKKHKKTKLTEIFSTRTGFNKTQDASKTLYFTSESKLKQYLKKHNFELNVVENTVLTSNQTFIAKKAMTEYAKI